MSDANDAAGSLNRADVDIVIPGNTLEGGGGVIRDCLTYATLLDKKIRIESIRADRPDAPGLRSEHTVAIDTMSSLCNAKVEGNAAQSQTLVYSPYANPISSSEKFREQLEVNLRGSASISLIALLPYLLFSHLSPAPNASRLISPDGIDLNIRGGTLCIKAPSYAYLNQVLIPTLNMIGLAGHIILDPEHEQGWHTDFAKFPGLIKARVKPLQRPLPAFQLLGRGKVVEVLATGEVPASEVQLFKEILETELMCVFARIGKAGGQLSPAQIIRVDVANQPGQYHLLLAARTESPEAYLGYEQVYPQKEGFPKELEQDPRWRLIHLARVCLKGLVEELQTGSAVDDHLGDILTPYQALAVGKSTIAVTIKEGSKAENGVFGLGEIDEKYHFDTSSLHKETAHWVAEKMAGVKFQGRGSFEECEGIGLGHKPEESGRSAL